MNKIGIFLVIIAVLCFVTAVTAFVLSFFGWQDPFTYGDGGSLTITLGFLGFSLGLSLAALSELIAWIFQSLVRPRPPASQYRPPPPWLPFERALGLRIAP